MNLANAIPMNTERRVVKTWTEQLLTELTEREKWDLATQVCQLSTALARTEEIKKAQAKDLGDKIKALREEIDKSARAVMSGSTYAEVEVEERYDVLEDLVYRIRGDTGEVLTRRKATEADRDLTDT